MVGNYQIPVFKTEGLQPFYVKLGVAANTLIEVINAYPHSGKEIEYATDKRPPRSNWNKFQERHQHDRHKPEQGIDGVANE